MLYVRTPVENKKQSQITYTTQNIYIIHFRKKMSYSEKKKNIKIDPFFCLCFLSLLCWFWERKRREEEMVKE